MNHNPTCPNCGATKPNINTFQPTPDEAIGGSTSELDCKKCNLSYEWNGRQWVPR